MLAAFAFLGTPAGPSAASAPEYHLFIRGRPDAFGARLIDRGGRLFVDIRRAVKDYGGSFAVAGGERALRVTIKDRSASFSVGTLTAQIQGKPVTLTAAPFILGGEPYIPIVAFAEIAGAELSVDHTHRRADLTPQTPLPTAVPSDEHETDGLQPSPAQALRLLPSASIEADGLHLRAELKNISDRPYTIGFSTGARVLFFVARDGTPVWDSSTGRRYTQSLASFTLAPGETKVFDDLWPQFGAEPAGRYTLRARMLMGRLLESGLVSIGVVTPAPQR